MLSVILGVVSVVAAYFLWCYIHEMSHVLMVKKLVGIQWYKIRLLPDFKSGSIRFASCQYLPVRERTDDEIAAISMAPRIPDLIAAFLLPFGALFLGGLLLQFWIIFLGAGVVDLIWGSIGYSPSSDLRTAAAAQGQTPTAKRLAGFFFAAVSIVATLLLLL